MDRSRDRLANGWVWAVKQHDSATVTPAAGSLGRLKVLASPASSGADGNPYIDLLYDGLRTRGISVEPFTRRALLSRPDVVHVHWPDFLVRWGASRRERLTDVATVLGLLFAARRRGAVVVWTGHNLRSQDSRDDLLRSWFLHRFAAQTDLLISLGEAAVDQLRGEYAELRRTPVAVIRHGHYRGAYSSPPTRERAREELGLAADSTVFLTIGQIRRYKNVEGLVRVFLGDHRTSEVLLVAGEVRDDGLEKTITGLADASAAIRLALARVPTADVPRWHAAADAVVLPYNAPSVLHSGAALLALSFDRPVVVTDSPTMRELRELVGSTWVHIADGTPRDALRAARAAVGVTGSPDLSVIDWPAIADQTSAAYASAVRRRRP